VPLSRLYASQSNRTPEEWRAAASGRLVRLGLVPDGSPRRGALLTGDYSRPKPSAVITGDYTRRPK
jgi:hypothetical protein